STMPLVAATTAVGVVGSEIEKVARGGAALTEAEQAIRAWKDNDSRLAWDKIRQAKIALATGNWKEAQRLSRDMRKFIGSRHGDNPGMPTMVDITALSSEISDTIKAERQKKEREGEKKREAAQKHNDDLRQKVKEWNEKERVAAAEKKPAKTATTDKPPVQELPKPPAVVDKTGTNSPQKSRQIKIHRDYHKNGKIQNEYEYYQLESGWNAGSQMKHGYFKSWHENGNIEIDCEYFEDQFQGKYSQYHENGKISDQGQYASGQKTGTWKWWTDYGVLVSETEYREGKKHGNFIENSSVNGRIVWSGQFVDDKREGVWKNRNEHGVVIEQGSFANDKKIGIWETCYLESGQIINGNWVGIFKKYKKTFQDGKETKSDFVGETKVVVPAQK
ncbi:MAG: hypothetical protein AB1403_03035, partial [Candidatus Riflebacteria bacterium]